MKSLRYAIIGTFIASILVLGDVQARGSNVLSFIQPGKSGPSTEAIYRDFPNAPQVIPSGTGHDGQQYYAIARSPFALKHTAKFLDRPRYRLQHPLFSWLAWILHPIGGGPGLIWAMVIVGFAAMLLGAFLCGLFSESLGGSALPALLFPILGGCLVSLRIGVADTLGVALLIAALLALQREHFLLAIFLAIACVLTKEIMFIPLLAIAAVGWVHGNRKIALMPLATMLVSGAWAVFLLNKFPHTDSKIIEFSFPFVGLLHSAAFWMHGHNLFSAFWVIGALVVAIIAIKKNGLSHPLSVALLATLAVTVCLSRAVLYLNLNGPRGTLPLLAIAMIAIFTPRSATSTWTSQRSIAN